MARYAYNEMRLPARLVGELERDTVGWVQSAKLLGRVVPVQELALPSLYRWESIEKETDAWLLLATEDEPERVGRIDAKFSPGIVDPYQVVLIGDVSPDCPIALDYRGTVDRPCVLYFQESGCWVKVADSFEEFWARMNAETR